MVFNGVVMSSIYYAILNQVTPVPCPPLAAGHPGLMMALCQLLTDDAHPTSAMHRCQPTDR